MSVQMPQSRTWPKIFAARGDGPGKGISPIYRIPSGYNTPSRESEHEDAGKPHEEYNLQIEEMFKETIRQQGFSSQKIGKRKQVNDEEALAGALKEISNEVESFQTLYNNQWLNNETETPDVMKPLRLQDSRKVDERANIFKLNEIPLKVRSKDDIPVHVTKTMPISSLRDVARQSSKTKTREQGKYLESELSKLNLSQKTVSSTPSHAEYITKEKQVHNKAAYMTSAAARPVTAHRDFERQDFKTEIGMMRTKATQAESVETMSPNSITQAQTCGEASRSQHNEFRERRAEVDDSANALTDAERQTFKDAINAMNAETEREEKRAAKVSSKSVATRRSGLVRTSKEHRRSGGAAEKTPIWSSSSVATVNVRKYNRQNVPGTGKLVHSQSATNKPQHIGRVFSDVHVHKERRAAAEPLVKREIQENQKAAIYHGFPYTKPKSVTSISNVKNGNFQAGFVKAVPLETGVLHLSPSAPLVSKHYTTKNMPPTTSQSKLQRRSMVFK